MNLPARADAESIALKSLVYIGADRERLRRFLALSGLDVEGLRAAASESGFLAGVLDHIAGDERLLLDFAAEADLDPQRIAWARAILAKPKGLEEP